MNTLLLKSKRALFKVTQKDMADKLGITYVTYSLKENGKLEFTRKEISTISKVLNLKLEDINEIFFDSEITKRIISKGGI